MKPTIRVLRTTLAGGVLFLVPIVVLIVILEKAAAIAHRIVGPLAERLPESVIGLRAPVFLAIAVLVLFCFAAGMLARTALANRLVSRLESSVLSAVPGYLFVKAIGESLLGVESTLAYPTVLVRGEDAWRIGFLIERLESGILTVFLPDSPNPNSGSVCFVNADCVQPVAVSQAAAFKCLKRLGLGANPLLRGAFAPNGAPDRSPLQ